MADSGGDRDRDHIDDAMFLRDLIRVLGELNDLNLPNRVGAMIRIQMENDARSSMIEAMKPYVQHLPSCQRAARRSLGGEHSGPCTCGLADKLPAGVVKTAERF